MPVRIDLEAAEGRPPLRAGMTASVSIDTQRERRRLTAAREAIAAWRVDRRLICGVYLGTVHISGCLTSRLTSTF